MTDNLPEIMKPNMDLDKAFREIIEVEVYIPIKSIQSITGYAIYRQNTAILRYRAEFTGNRWSMCQGKNTEGELCNIVKLYRPEEPKEQPKLESKPRQEIDAVDYNQIEYAEAVQEPIAIDAEEEPIEIGAEKNNNYCVDSFFKRIIGRIHKWIKR